MAYNFDEIIDRRSTESGKWNYFEEDVLPLWVADMDFVSPEPVIQALRDRVDHRIFGYPGANPNLEQAVINWLDKKHGWKVAKEDLIFIPGVITGFNLVSHAFTKPDENVLIQTPAYPPFFQVSNNIKVNQQLFELKDNGNGQYEIDFDELEKSIDADTKVFLLCNPHNPTGRVFTKEELSKIAEICIKKDILICSDEIHSDIVFPGQKHIPVASLSPEISSRTVTLIAPSKTFNIAGLKASVLICTNPEMREKLMAAKQGLLGGINLLGQVAAEAAYNEGEEWLNELMVYLEANRDFLFDYVNQELPGLKMNEPQGTYLAWINCRDAELGDCAQEFFLKNARVGLNAGEAFGEAGKDFVRLNFGCPRPILEEALQKMKKALLER